MDYSYDSLKDTAVAISDNFAFDVLATISIEDINAIFESGGMDNKKYRDLAMSEVASAVKAELGVSFEKMSEDSKRYYITVILVVIGMLLGTTSNNKRLLRTMGPYMEDRKVKGDVLAVGFKIATSHFKTFVFEKSSKKFPAIKYPTCMADYCLLGALILMSKHPMALKFYFDLSNQYADWPELLKKQWFGHFNLDDSLQSEHKAWEKLFWEKVVVKTTNESNKNAKDFKAEFDESIYENTALDSIPIRTIEGLAVETGGIKITRSMMASFCRYTMIQIAGVDLSHGGATAISDFDSNAPDESKIVALNISDVNNALARAVDGFDGLKQAIAVYNFDNPGSEGEDGLKGESGAIPKVDPKTIGKPIGFSINKLAIEPDPNDIAEENATGGVEETKDGDPDEEDIEVNERIAILKDDDEVKVDGGVIKAVYLKGFAKFANVAYNKDSDEYFTET